MRALVGCVAFLLAFSVIDPPDAGAISKRRQCKDACPAAIDRCIEQGGKKRKCRRQTLKTCRKQGVETCAVTTTSTTVRGGTTLPGGSTTTVAGGSTTTGPGGSVTTTSAPGGTTSTTLTTHGCTRAISQDLTGNPSPTVTFADFQYVPRCMIIHAGQTITFNGDFDRHPLVGGSFATVTPMPDPSSPIGSTGSGTSKSAMFPSAGTFPFYCAAHGFEYAMTGAVFVDP